MEVKIWRRRNRVEGEEEDWRDDGWDETVAGGGLSQRPVSGESEKNQGHLGSWTGPLVGEPRFGKAASERASLVRYSALQTTGC